MIRREITKSGMCVFYLLVLSVLVSCNIGNQNVTLVYKLDSYPAYHLIWSPSGKQLAFSTDSGSRNASAIYVLNVETKEARLFLNAEYGNLQAQTWTPDGSGLIFSANSSNEFEEGVWLADVNSGNAPKLFPDSGIAISWSTKNQIAIAQKNSDGTLSFFIQDAKTNDKKMIFSDSAIAVGSLSWSADSNKLAFGLDSGEFRRRDIYVYDLRTGEVHKLTSEGTNDSPSLSPDGNLVAYIKGNFSADTPSYSLHIMNSSGSCDTQVPGMANIGAPVWSPDGKQIAFVGSDNSIYLLNLFKVFGEGFITKGLSCS